MTLSWSEYFSRWFLAVVVWHSGPWRTIYLSEGSTIFGCLQVDPLVSANCCEGQWFRAISIEYYNGCYSTNPSDVLQLNSTVSCFGGQTGTSSGSSSSLCSGRGLQTCKENATLPVIYNGNNISAGVENECIEESDNHNVCGDLSDTVTGPLYLASPSLFIARVPSARTKCRCEVHADSFLQMEILFADVSVSRFTINCGQWNISQDSFSTNVTNWMVPIPQDSSDCVLEVDETFKGNSSSPVHKVWVKITVSVLSGSSLTFRCNSDTRSSSLTPPNTETSKADDSRSSLASSSSSSSQTSAASTFVTVTLSSQTSSLKTQQDTISMSCLTKFQTYSDSRDLGQDDYNRAALLHIIYIVVGVVGGILLVIIVILVVVVFLRKKKSNTTYDSLTHPNARRTRGGVHTDDNEHTYSVIRPAQRPDIQLTVAAAAAATTTDGQRLPSEELTIQTPGYENVGMTFLTEKSETIL